MSKNPLSFPVVAGLAAAVFLIALISLMGYGDYGFLAAVFMALVIGLLTGIIIYLAFGMEEGSSGSHASTASATAGAATGGSVSTDADADAESARKASDAEAKRKAAEEAAAAKAAEDEAARKAAAKAEAARAAEASATAATASGPIPASDLGEDYDGDGIREGTNEGTRPAGLDAPRDGSADDLKLIKGIGPKLEKLCNSLGFWHFDQVAAWSADEVAWVDANLTGFKGRVSRDEWVAQAKTLAAGGETEFSKRVEDGDVY